MPGQSLEPPQLHPEGLTARQVLAAFPRWNAHDRDVATRILARLVEYARVYMWGGEPDPLPPPFARRLPSGSIDMGCSRTLGAAESGQWQQGSEQVPSNYRITSWTLETSSRVGLQVRISLTGIDCPIDVLDGATVIRLSRSRQGGGGHAAAQPIAVCPRCGLALPATGACDEHGRP